MSDTNPVTVWIGIDISKETFDAVIAQPNGKRPHKPFANTPAGFSKLLRWVESLGLVEPRFSVRFCMESTGAYGMALAEHLVEGGHMVSIENPARIKHFGSALNKGAQNKTDKADARVIAEYAQAFNPAPWLRSQPEVKLLVALLRRLDSLEAHLQEENNRLGQPATAVPAEVKRSLEETIHFLQTEIERLKEQIERHIDQHPGLKADQTLLVSIPGISETTARRILAEMPDVSLFTSAKQAAAYAGLAPKECRSGTSVHKKTRISKSGNARLRSALYFPAITATRYNQPVKELYDRLIERGNSKMAALVAAMRKLLMIAYGVLKSRTTFSPDFVPVAGKQKA